MNFMCRPLNPMIPEIETAIIVLKNSNRLLAKLAHSGLSALARLDINTQIQQNKIAIEALRKVKTV